MNRIDPVIIAFASATAAACGSSSPTNAEPPVPDPAVASFYDDFLAARYSRARTQAAALDAAAGAEPTQGRLALLRAHAHLWHIAEFGRDPTQDQGALPAEASALIAQFQTARVLDPNDGRVACWLGAAQELVGRMSHDRDLVEQGLATIEEGVRAYPEFGLFCRALAYAPLPASDPDYAKAVDALFLNVDACFGAQVDRANPDITPYLGQETQTGPKRVCWNDPIAPHNLEGFLLFLGDLLVKQGQVGVARIAYNDVKLVPQYPSWPYKSLLDDRLNADLGAKAALYADADPSNDPPLGGNSIQHGCAYCHAATAGE
jgi:hypothetical protein